MAEQNDPELLRLIAEQEAATEELKKDAVEQIAFFKKKEKELPADQFQTWLKSIYDLTIDQYNEVITELESAEILRITKVLLDLIKVSKSKRQKRKAPMPGSDPGEHSDQVG